MMRDDDDDDATNNEVETNDHQIMTIMLST